MSLLLRQACQPVIDSVNLDDYHAEIYIPTHRWEGDKVMAIVGPCGKQLFKITGIQFSRTNPTQAEIAYAVELLEEFFRMHKKKLDAFLKTRKTYWDIKRTNNSLESKDGFTTSVSTDTVNSVQYATKDEHLVLLQNGNWMYENTTSLPLQQIGKLAKTKKIRDKLTARLQAAQVFVNARKQYNQAMTELTTCNI